MPKITTQQQIVRRERLVDLILPIMIERLGASLTNPNEAVYVRARIAEDAVLLANAVLYEEMARDLP